MTKIIVPFAVAIFLISCASNSGVVKSGVNSFFIEKQQSTGFPGLGTLKADVYKEANLHCADLNGSLKTVSYEETQPPYLLGNYPRVSLEFSC